MRKDDNDWCITDWNQHAHRVEINGEEYEVDTNTAALCHSLLLLVDAINDKNGCEYGKREMDSENAYEKGCASRGNGCSKGKENPCKETRSCC